MAKKAQLAENAPKKAQMNQSPSHRNHGHVSFKAIYGQSPFMEYRREPVGRWERGGRRRGGMEKKKKKKNKSCKDRTWSVVPDALLEVIAEKVE